MLSSSKSVACGVIALADLISWRADSIVIDLQSVVVVAPRIPRIRISHCNQTLRALQLFSWYWLPWPAENV
jgi:hypothetical protein